MKMPNFLRPLSVNHSIKPLKIKEGGGIYSAAREVRWALGVSSYVCIRVLATLAPLLFVVPMWYSIAERVGGYIVDRLIA